MPELETPQMETPEFETPGASSRRRPAGPEQAVPRDAYCLLKRDVERAGCFAPTPWHHLGDAVFVLAAYVTGFVVLLGDPDTAQRIAALALVAFASVRAGIIAHEAGHGAMTGNRRLASAYGHFFMTFLTALAFGHWLDIHRRHHPNSNDPARDPDTQSGLFSMYLDSAFEKRGLARAVTRRQAYLIWILVTLQGFSLKVDSVRFMCRKPRAARADWTVMPLHLGLWFGLPVYFLGIGDAALNYVLMTWFLGPYLGAIFLVNHIGTRIIEPGEDIPFLHHQVLTTRNLGTSRFADFLFGGLNNHIEHHLFPTMPKARLRRARRITRDFCRRNGIPYREMSWWSACAEVFRHFRAVSRAAYGRAVVEAPPLAVGPAGSTAAPGRVVEAASAQAIMR